MSKNILSKFRKSLEESSKIIHNSRCSVLDHHSQHGLPQQKQLQYIRQQTNRSELSPSRMSNIDNKKLLSKIPVLVNENENLKERIKKLEAQLQDLRKEKQLKDTFQKITKLKSNVQGNNSERKERISRERSHSMLNNLRLYQSSRYDNQRYKRSRGFSLSPHTQQKKIDFTILQSGLVIFLEKQIEELRNQNEDLKNKYNRILAEKNSNNTDIDIIQLNFLATIANQQENFTKKEQYYQQKIKILESKISQVQYENQVTKLQLSSLTEKLSTCQKMLAKKQQKYKDPILTYKSKCVQEKKGFAPNIHINYVTKCQQDKSNGRRSLDHLYQRRFR